MMDERIVLIVADALRDANRYPARDAGGDPVWQATVERITMSDARAVVEALRKAGALRTSAWPQ